MKWIHVWSSHHLPVIVLDSPFVFHAWLPTYIRARVPRYARSPYQWQQSSVINKLRIFFALICLEAFFPVGFCRNMFGDDSASASIFNWIRGKSGLIHSPTGVRGGWIRKKTGDEVVSELPHQLLLLHCWDVEDFFGVEYHGRMWKPVCRLMD